jgi:hypothetical protein
VKVKTYILLGLSVLLLLLFSIFMKALLYAYQECEQGKVAFRNKLPKQAIVHFSRAIHWYTPGNGAIKASIEGLWEIGRQAEERGDETLALEALQNLRSSLYSARSFYTPHMNWIEVCDEHIAMILARQEGAHLPDGDKLGLRARKTRFLKVLKRPTEPNVFWSLILEVGFIGWVGCTIAFIFQVFSGEQGFQPGRAFFWGVLVASFYACWIVGMLHA